MVVTLNSHRLLGWGWPEEVANDLLEGRTVVASPDEGQLAGCAELGEEPCGLQTQVWP